MYPKNRDEQTPASPSFPQIEEGILAFWKGDDTFRASIAQREGSPEWVFYDGPPFANGLPHFGHLLTGYVKDVFPRFQTMRGKKVDRRFGWDTHGLPAELETMKQLGITTTREIEDMGIDVFNAKAKDSVLKYTREWEEYVTRQARWVDFENDYKTLNPEFMESALWAFKTLYDKGLAFEGYRVLPYCWRDETPLSNHELRMDDDVYKDRQDPAVTVGFEVTTPGQFAGSKLVIWTTTPWTLPSNLLVMIGSDIDYSMVEVDGDRLILATARLSAYARELGEEPNVIWSGKGTDLLGLEYVPPFSYFEGHEGAFRVVAADDAVTTTDGTGLVHSAGAFGEVDKEVTDREGIEPVMPVGKDGAFTAPVTDYLGQLVFDANKQIIRDLGRTEGSVTAGTVLVRHETYNHSYPHCWRCGNPLIYKGVSSWFVRVTQIKDQLIAANEQINWVPENVKHGQFGKWLEGARDWSISRNRYFGTPIPVWVSDSEEYPRIDVYGSFAELERDFGRLPLDEDGQPNLHRPYIDELTRPNPDDPTGASVMRRIEDVFDVWFDSGSMPFAQVHYPFENEAWFDSHSPADFIVEYIGQTRGWFYVMHVLSVALFGRPAFTNVIAHGIVLGSDGQKASKKLRNYPDVNESFDTYGSDAIRWMLVASSILRGGNLSVSEAGIRDALRQFHLPLWSTWYFFSTYANRAIDGAPYEAVRRIDSKNVLDRYILAKLRETIDTVESSLDALEMTGATGALRDFVDVLTNWYVRRSRDRFWEGVSDDPSSTEAFDTLFTVLETLTQVAAPIAPLTTEEIWKGLTGGRSVHLTDWPDAAQLPADPALVETMDHVRQVASVGNALRKARQKRVRLPLPRLTVVSDIDAADFVGVLRDELNVREVVLEAQQEDSLERFGIGRTLQVNARAAGPRIGKDVQQAIKGSKSGDWSIDGDTVVSGGIALIEGEYELKLEVRDEEAAVGFIPSGGFVVLDTTTTPELEAEGAARDVVRAVQDARKQAGLDVSDRIALRIIAPNAADLAANKTLIADETLATSLDIAAGDELAIEVEKA